MKNIIFNKTEYGAKSVCNGKDVMGMRNYCMETAGVLGQRIACSGEVSCGLETAERALTKIGNDPGAVLVRCRRSAVVLGCSGMSSGSNLGQIEISVRGVALGCVAQARTAAGELFRSVVNPVLAAA